LDQQAVELVGEQVDRGVDIHAVGLGMQGMAGEVDGGFGTLLVLDHAEQGTHVQGLFEVAAQSRELGFDVFADGGGDFDLLAVGFDAHFNLLGLFRLSGPQHRPERGRCCEDKVKRSGAAMGQQTRTRSWDDGMFMASRYLATVRRATGMPLASRACARRASDSGLRGSSAAISRRIIDWIAVLDASPPPPVSMPE